MKELLLFYSTRLMELARDASPDECCGILFHLPFAGINQHLVVPLPNVAPNTDREFLIDHTDYLQACLHANATPWALYHSHPTGTPAPSVTDCRLMDALETCHIPLSMVIVGLHPASVRVYEKRAHVYAMVEEVDL